MIGEVSAPAFGTADDTIAAMPFVKWPGGKRWLTPTLVPVIREYLARTGGVYREPFLGGGAMALGLASPKAVLSDGCPQLIEAYRAVQQASVAVSKTLQEFVRRRPPSERAYYEVRNHFNGAHGDSLTQTARFLYLMTYGYNGVFRVNSSGGYNVPWGKCPENKTPSLETLRAVQTALVGAEILDAQDFEGALANARGGDLIFADPPYADSFDGYTKEGFSPADQERLANQLKELHKKGVAILMTNADTPEIRRLYAWAEPQEVAEDHKVRPHGSRKRASCLLARAGIWF